MTTNYYVSEEFVDKHSSGNYCENETNKKYYDNFEEAIVDFNKRIIALEETEFDNEFWDIRLHKVERTGNSKYGDIEESLYIYYTTQDDQYIVYK